MSHDDAKNVVFEGIVYKKGEGFMAGWKKRYLILYIDKRLSYLIVDGEKKGNIDIKHLSKEDIKESAKTNKMDNYGFHICTDNRIWEFSVKTKSERDEWINQIWLTLQGKASLRIHANTVIAPSTNSSVTVEQSYTKLASPINLGGGSLNIQNRNVSKSAYAPYTNRKQQHFGFKHAPQLQKSDEKQKTFNLSQPQQPISHHQSFSTETYKQKQSQQQTVNAHHKKSHSLQPNPWAKKPNKQRAFTVNFAKPKPIKQKQPYTKAKSKYLGFKANKYDNNTRFSCLLSGLFREFVGFNHIKLQNLCMQYIGFLMFDPMHFPDSNIVRDYHNKTLLIDLLCRGMNDFFVKDIELIYRGSRDGLNAAMFHSKCDGIPKTLTLCYSNYGVVFGGYTNIPWSVDQKYHQDDNAFLFATSSSFDNAKIFKLKQNESKHAVFHFKEMGPVFGKGHDLAIFSLSDNGWNSQSMASSYCFKARELIGSWMYCKIMEIEIFRIYTQ